MIIENGPYDRTNLAAVLKEYERQAQLPQIVLSTAVMREKAIQKNLVDQFGIQIDNFEEFV